MLRSNREVRTGVVHVSSKVWGYRKVCKKTLRILSMHEFSLPNLEFTTRATWIDVPKRAPARDSRLQPDFNVSVVERCDTSPSAVLRELDARHRSVQVSAESTSM